MKLYPELDPAFTMPADDDPRFELASELLKEFKEQRTQFLSPMKTFGFSQASSGLIASREEIASSMRIEAQALQEATGFDMEVGTNGIQLVTAHLHSPYGFGRRRLGRWGRC